MGGTLSRTTLSFVTIFQKAGKAFREYLQNNILMQRDIDGKNFIPSKGGIIGTGKKARVSKVGMHTRLLVTGKLNKGAFKSTANDTSLTVYADNTRYPAKYPSQDATYADIIFYNNKPTSDNLFSPLVFPTTESELEKTKPFQNLMGMMDGEVTTYFENVLGVDIKRIVKI